MSWNGPLPSYSQYVPVAASPPFPKILEASYNSPDAPCVRPAPEDMLDAWIHQMNVF